MNNLLIDLRRDKSCPIGNDCPAVKRHVVAELLVVQGYRTGRPGVVRVPASLLPEWDSPARRQGDDLLITGRPVTDPAVLVELDLPEGESAVLVDPADVPALAEVLA